MSKEELNIDYENIARYLAEEASPEERTEIRQWINGSNENRAYFNQCKKLFWLNYTESSEKGSSFQFDTKEAWNNVRSQLEGFTYDGKLEVASDINVDDRNLLKNYPWVRIAAVLVIGVSAVFLLFNRLSSTEVTIAANESPLEHYLPDSTQVILDESATLSYDKRFNKGNREVRLTGKAYFDVKRNENLAFEINTKSGIIRVLGTAFVVEENSDSLYVIVERGKVQLNSSFSTNTDQLILQRNQRGVLDIENGILETTDLNDVNDLYWANKKLTYRQERLTIVFDQLSKLFNIEINYDQDIIQNCSMSAVFQDQSFEEMLQNMSLSMNFEFSRSGNRVDIVSEGCEEN